ncbi:MAG: CARDB domain-containing protein [Nanoarchaeota archaeon]
MVRLPNIPLIVLILVLGYVFFSTFSGQTGFAAAGCSGNSVLELTPSQVQVNEPITAKVSGLSNCLGQKIILKEGSDLCNGQIVKSYICNRPDCNTKTIFYKGHPKTYSITACVDKDNDGYLIEQGERSTSVLTVTSLPDFKIDSIKYSITPKDGYSFYPLVTVSNIGVAGSIGVDVKFEVLTKDGARLKTVYEKIFLDVALPASKVVALDLRQMTLSKGDYIVKVQIDYIDYIVENNEQNNVLQQNLLVR